jgi:hypothetical protein
VSGSLILRLIQSPMTPHIAMRRSPREKVVFKDNTLDEPSRPYDQCSPTPRDADGPRFTGRPGNPDCSVSSMIFPQLSFLLLPQNNYPYFQVQGNSMLITQQYIEVGILLLIVWMARVDGFSQNPPTFGLITSGSTLLSNKVAMNQTRRTLLPRGQRWQTSCGLKRLVAADNQVKRSDKISDGVCGTARDAA